MSIFDSIKSAFGKGEAEADSTTPPSQLLREAGLDPSGLRFSFGNRSITVSGEIADESQRQEIINVLQAIRDIDTVQDELVAAEPGAPAAETPSEETEAAGGAAADEAASGEQKTYTVVSGDTLWRIAQQVYGNGSQYMKIFEANTDILQDPDRILPGQVLKIPDLS